MKINFLGRALCGVLLASSFAIGQQPPGFAQYPDSADAPQAITTGPDGALWFIGNGIGRITISGVITEMTQASAVAGKGIVAGPDGALWFLDDASNSVGRITTSGSVTEFPIPTPNSQPNRIAVGSDGTLWFTEGRGSNIGRATTAGKITEFPLPTAGSAPFDITAGPDGALWFTEGIQIGRITTAGSVTEFTAPGYESTGHITAGPDGALWYTAPQVGLTVDQSIYSGAIGRLTTTGVFTNVTPLGVIDPLGITFGSDGALWFINFGGLELGRYTLAGASTEYSLQNGSAVDITTGPDGALWIAETGYGIVRAPVTGVSVPTISSTPLPPGGIGIAYFASLSATGGVPPYNFWEAGEGIPPGLSLDPSSGTITGTPSAVGTFNFTVSVRDSDYSVSAPQNLSITITQAPQCTYLLAEGGQIFSFAGGSGSITVTTAQGCQWSVSGAPSWLTLAAATVTGPGTTNFTVAANNSVVSLDATLTVAGFPFTIQQAAALPDIIPGIPQQLTFSGSMPHLAAEGGWNTTFTLVNKGAGLAVAQASFIAPDGTPLTLPVNFPQQPATTQLSSTSSLDETIAANATFIVEATGPANVPDLVGSAQLASTGSVDGFEIFHYDPTNQEAVVPLQMPSGILVLPFDNTNGVVTGIAAAGTGAGTVQVILRDDTGTQIGTGSFPLASNGHTSFVLSTQFPVTANIRGTVELAECAFGSDTVVCSAITALGIRYTPPGTLTTIPAFATPGGTASATEGIMAHVASGAGWQTTFVLVNTAANPAQAQLNFYDDNGNPLMLPLTFPQTGATSTASSVAQTIASDASLWIQSSGETSTALLTGSAQLTGVSGFAIYRYNVNGQEAVVPLETRNAGSYVIAFDNTDGIATGLAISTVSTQAVNVPVILRDDTGAQIGTGSIPLAANGHSSQMLTTLFPATANIRGTVEFDTPAGAQISVLGIRSPPALTFTTLPALAK